MKLIFCPHCEDVFKLRQESKSCKCGKSGGYYHQDGVHATISGDAIPVGFTNSSFIIAYYEWKKGKNQDIWGTRFDAFIIPLTAPTIHKEK